MTRWEKRLVVLLALSVALNVLVFGFVIGRRLRHPHGHRPHGALDLDASLGPAVGRSPALRKLIDQAGADLDPRREAARIARGRVSDALAHEPFDRTLLDRELASLRGETARVQEAVHHALAEAASSATVEDRRAMAGVLETSRHGPRRRR